MLMFIGNGELGIDYLSVTICTQFGLDFKSFMTIILWFRENLLFHIEDSDSEKDRFEDGQVMAHELSHQVEICYYMH